MQLGRVFISSVFGGLLDLRAAAAGAARLAGLHPVLAEHRIAGPRSVREGLERAIASCDCYLGLFDWRRGTVPRSGTADRRAITEEELRIARSLGLRCLVFLSHRGKGSREPGLEKFLAREVTDYAGGVWTRPFRSARALRREVVAGLAALRPRLVLALDRTDASGGFEATLDLAGVQPAWRGERRVGPVATALGFGAAVAGVLDAFRRGEGPRSRLPEERLRLAGAELAAAAFPGPLGAALADTVALAAASGSLLALEVRSADAGALALPWELLSPAAHPLPVREGLIEILRRPGLAGEALDLDREPSPDVPPLHLAVLGFTAAPVEDLAEETAPGMGGLGDADLFWEREQERLLMALEGLVRERRGRLVLPDTGDAEELRLELARSERPQVIHIACHGGMGADGEPVLLLENGDGRRAAVGAADLLGWARATPGASDLELMVLAACSTAGPLVGTPLPGGRAAPPHAVAAAATSGAQGLAERLVAGGIPRVVGMQSTISDAGATAFAGGFYAALGRGADLMAALRAGRCELAAQGHPHEWAVPVLLTRRGAGPLASAEGSAPPVATPVEVARRELDIAGVSYLGEGYVGRRDRERELVQAFARGERLLVVHGLGGIGKSTFAARFVERRRAAGARVMVLPAGRPLQPAPLIEEVAAALGVAHPAAAASEDTAAAAARFRRALAAALATVRPTLLLLDNFEDNQDDEGACSDPALGEALIDLALLGGRGFAIMLTSRLRLTLPPGPVEPWNLDLGPLPPSGCRKLRLLDPAGLGSLDEADWRRALRELGGHPKALELLGGYLRGRPERARLLLASWSEAAAAVDSRLAARRQERGRQLLVEAVLAAVPAAREPALDRLCLLDEPLPTAEIEELLAADGIAEPAADLAWLRGHGLLARTAAPSALTGGDAIHRLLASRRQGALAARNGAGAARAWHARVATHLERRRGPASDFGAAARHHDAAGDRAAAIELYGRWALALRDGHAYRACIQVAREGLAVFPAGGAEEQRAAAAGLWLRIAEGSRSLGELAAADSAVKEALALVAEPQGAEALLQRALAMGSQADVLEARGELDEALRIRRDEQLPVYERLGDVHSRAVTLGKIADVLEARGELDEALRIRRDEQLPVFERLGDVRSRAVTLGRIADVLVARGELDEALRIRRDEQLPVYERLGDVRSRAVTLGRIADVLVARGELDEALRIRRDEELPVFERLGDVRSRAVTLGKIADVLQARGELDEALRIRRDEELPVYERLGDVHSRAVTLGQIADVLQARGELDEALRIRRDEQLPVFERLGDVRERAVTLGKIADVLQARGELDEALHIRRDEQLPVFERLGDVRSRAVTLGKIADVLQTRGELDEALRIRHDEQLPVYERLGDVRSRAVTLGKIADVLQARGELDEALRIRRDEQLPVFERLGDVRERAVTLGRIADVLQARGELDEALRVRRDEELPVFERLGDVRELLVARANLAITLRARSAPGDLAEGRSLLRLALAAAERMRIPEVEIIRQLLQSFDPPSNDPAAGDGVTPK